MVPARAKTPYTTKALEGLYRAVTAEAATAPATPDDKKRQQLLLKHKHRVCLVSEKLVCSFP